MRKSIYDSTDTDCRNATQRQRHYFDECIRIASKSYLTHKHGCVLVKHGRIVSRGFNFRLPEKLAQNSNVPSVHAEISALHNVNKHIVQNSDMYVVRLGDYLIPERSTEEPNEPVRQIRRRVHMCRYSRPCSHCSNEIKKYGVRNVYYSINQT